MFISIVGINVFYCSKAYYFVGCKLLIITNLPSKYLTLQFSIGNIASYYLTFGI